MRKVSGQSVIYITDNAPQPGAQLADYRAEWQREAGRPHNWLSFRSA